MKKNIQSTLFAAVYLAALVAFACSPPESDHFSPEPYVEDLEQLAKVTATTYANFEWAIIEGDVDPVALYAEAHETIRTAESDEAAREALEGFVDRFGDGHFRLREPSAETRRGQNSAAGPRRDSPAAEACAQLGYETHDQSFRVDLGEGFELLTALDDPFPAGWLERTDGTRIGVLRIDEFGANRFGEYCPEIWEAFRHELEERCADWPCVYAFRLRMVEHLLDEVSDRVGKLAAARIDALVVDITANGGGTDWIDPTARMLTGTTLLGNELSVVRHPHWQGILKEMASEVETDLARDSLSDAQRGVLGTVLSRLQAGIVQTSAPCDLSVAWERGANALPCSLLVHDVLYTTGLTPEPPGIAIEGLASGTSLFKSFGYRSRQPVWTGPLAVLTDEYTASASELFTALLRDNDAAVVIGRRTAGVGCGYSNGGTQTLLEHSGLEIWLPDCVRHRRDGSNERDGIAPDLAVDWQPGDSALVKGEKLRQVFNAWPPLDS
jgi:hypothetical protein